MKTNKHLHLVISGLYRLIGMENSGHRFVRFLAVNMTFCRASAQIKLVRLGLAFLFLLGSALAQTDPNAGIPGFSTQLGGQYDSVSPATSKIEVAIPGRRKTG